MTENYHQHLDDRKRKTLIMNGAVVNSAYSHSLLRVVFLDSAEGIAAFGDALAAGWPALLDMGANLRHGVSGFDPRDGRRCPQRIGSVGDGLDDRTAERRAAVDGQRARFIPTLLKRIEDGAFRTLQKVVFVRFPGERGGTRARQTLRQRGWRNSGDVLPGRRSRS